MIESGALVEHPVDILDVSMGGCLIKSAKNLRLRPGEKVWLQAMGEISSPVMDGLVVSAVKPFFGSNSIRVRFLSPLSFQTFKMLVYGTEEIDRPVVIERPEHENDQFWR